MSNLPSPVLDHLVDVIVHQRKVAYLEVSKAGILISSGGHLSDFGISDFTPGIRVEDCFDLLFGMLNVEELPCELPYMTMPSGVVADIHLFVAQERIWVLLVHADQQHQQRQVAQQHVNDLSLSHQQQSKILNQYLGQEVAERLAQGIEHVDPKEEPQQLTVMFADLRAFSTFSETSAADEVFELLNEYLETMIDAILETNGVLDKIIGDEIMAIFGMLEEEENAPDLATHAAIRILTRIEKINRPRRRAGKKTLEVGIGIATGPASLSVLGSENRKSITVIGKDVNLAAHLQEEAQGRQVIIDGTTYQSLTRLSPYFESISVRPKGKVEDMDAYRLSLQDLVIVE